VPKGPPSAAHIEEFERRIANEGKDAAKAISPAPKLPRGSVAQETRDPHVSQAPGGATPADSAVSSDVTVLDDDHVAEMAAAGIPEAIALAKQRGLLPGVAPKDVSPATTTQQEEQRAIALGSRDMDVDDEGDEVPIPLSKERGDEPSPWADLTAEIDPSSWSNRRSSRFQKSSTSSTGKGKGSFRNQRSSNWWSEPGQFSGPSQQGATPLGQSSGATPATGATSDIAESIILEGLPVLRIAPRQS
jgi:hypothetical protein